MRRDKIKFLYAGALIALVIQVLLIVNKFFNASLYYAEDVKAEILKMQDRGFGDLWGLVWSSLLGTVILCIFFINRLLKGSNPLFQFLGVVLWFLQFYFLYEESTNKFTSTVTNFNFFEFIFSYLFGFLGALAILIVTVYDLTLGKKQA